MLQRSATAVSRRLDDRTVVVNLETNQIFQLNHTASALWELVDGRRDRDEIERALVSEFAAEAPQVAGDVDRILGELAARGLTSDDGHD